MFLIFTGAYYGAISYFRRGCCRKLEVLSIKWRRFQRRWSANSTRWATSMLVRHILLLTVRLQLCRMSSGDGYGGLKGRLGVGSQLGRRSWTSFLQKVYSSVNIVKIICFVQLWLHGGNSTSRLVWLCMGATSLARTGVSLIHLRGEGGEGATLWESYGERVDGYRSIHGVCLERWGCLPGLVWEDFALECITFSFPEILGIRLWGCR